MEGSPVSNTPTFQYKVIRELSTFITNHQTFSSCFFSKPTNDHPTPPLVISSLKTSSLDIAFSFRSVNCEQLRAFWFSSHRPTPPFPSPSLTSSPPWLSVATSSHNHGRRQPAHQFSRAFPAHFTRCATRFHRIQFSNNGE